MDFDLEDNLEHKHALAGIFLLGLAVGFGAGVTSSMGGPESGAIELDNTEYPFEGVEAGVSESTESNNSTFNVEGEPYLGTGDTKVVAYEDFECPFCSKYNSGAFPQIIENDVKSGEVTYYMKNYPLQSIHPWATKAAMASECALNQDPEVYWTFSEGFYDQQSQLKQAYKTGNFDESMTRWAEQTGLDVEQFNTCYSEEEEMEEIREDVQQGGRLGTPTIFVGEQKISGAQPYSIFKDAIESAK